LLPPLQRIINWQNTNPQIRPSERNRMSTPVPLVDFFLMDRSVR
jgi:hypothetical protein